MESIFILHSIWMRKHMNMSACGRQPHPTFLEPLMANVTALKGQDVEFRCKVNNLGKHMVSRFIHSSLADLNIVDPCDFLREISNEFKETILANA
ncbi:unnamed protein product [Anisakis simplex]|uniref:Ig-like domain-containing protein n=1 Tax=Anisakis simplex TaxID=6269 RepID=A0A0M3JBV3_ANISI|nr:unnamed protein product [Anisakis simplex]